jgi:hypothetical protein
VVGQEELLAGDATFGTGNPPSSGITLSPSVFVVIMDEGEDIVTDSMYRALGVVPHAVVDAVPPTIPSMGQSGAGTAGHDELV